MCSCPDGQHLHRAPADTIDIIDAVDASDGGNDTAIFAAGSAAASDARGPGRGQQAALRAGAGAGPSQGLSVHARVLGCLLRAKQYFNTPGSFTGAAGAGAGAQNKKRKGVGVPLNLVRAPLSGAFV